MKGQQLFTRDWFSGPADSIRHLMAAKGVSTSDLAEALHGDNDLVRGVLSGSVPVDYTLAASLASILGGSCDFWLDRQERYELHLTHAATMTARSAPDDWLKAAPVPASAAHRRSGQRKRIEEIRRRLAFYNVPNARVWQQQYGRLRASTRYRTSASYVSDEGALCMWLRQAELEADMSPTKPWNPDLLRGSINDVRRLTRISRPARFLPALREILANAGVAMVIVRAPRGCRVSGASRMVAPDKALLAASFRYRADDQFWFTLFHEIGHLLLHQEQTFVDDDETCVDDEFEREANDFARSCIIPARDLPVLRSLVANRRSVVRFSVSIGVAAGLVVGQMQHMGLIGFDRLNSLKRRWNWQEIERELV